jgi:rhomboid protease GluP
VSQYPVSPQGAGLPEGQPQASQPGGPEAGARSIRVSLPNRRPYLTYTIAGFTVLVYLLQVGSTYLFGYANPSAGLDWLEVYGAMISSGVRAGEVWRLLTPMLLHASVPHILFNMYALVVFGTGLERNFGHWRFLILYILGGFAGNVLSFLHLSGSSYSVGASTAIFGLVGAEGIFLYQNRKLFGRQFGRLIGNIIFVVAVNLFLVGLAPGIDNWGHIGGLLGGLIFAWFAGPIWEVQGNMTAPYMADRREARNVITGAAIVIAIFGALAVWGMLSPIGG